MLDLHAIRSAPEAFQAALARKGVPPEEVTALLELDAARREILVRVEALKARRNDASLRIGRMKKSGEDTSALQAETRAQGDEIRARDKRVVEIEGEIQGRLLRIPNVPHASVPDGADESGNVAVKTWGEPPRLDFTALSHEEIGVRLGILDFERAAKLSGSRFVVYRGAGALLERALISFMLDLHATRHGYTEVIPPYLVRPEALVGTGNLPKFEADLFKVDGGDFYLIPTAEVPVTNLHRDEILEEADLPLSYCAFTPCFRSEAGSYGKDVKGMIRQHQFHKVELVKFSRPEESYHELERLTSHAEAVLEALGLHYRRVLLCAGDMSFSSAKTYDLEIWLPSQGCFREISSCSNFEDFQARRANIRYRPAGGGKPRLVHTLNGSGLAVGRTFVALLEQFQRPDGSVGIPGVLRPYCGGKDSIEVDRS
ncbi:MAG: serine--tRNA ligase [Acidobacteriota bacterium]